jgi:hypothetical protein
MALLNEIAASCRGLKYRGLYLKILHNSKDEDFELRLIGCLDSENRREIASIIQDKQIQMTEVHNLGIFFSNP